MSDKYLLWEKYRPKKIEDIILPNRIKNIFLDGVDQHYILYGHYGTGKTSLAKILIGHYSKESAFLEVNCSDKTSIDFLRNDISTFCNTVPMMETKSNIKYVLLDEFDRVSPEFQDAFKAFIERYNKNVRFIITTNHINRINRGILSRTYQINFDDLNIEETKQVKRDIYKRISDIILPSEDKKVDKDLIIELIKKNYPDLRSILVSLQEVIKNGESNHIINSISQETKFNLYNLIISKSNYKTVYDFLLTNFGAENIDEMLNALGRPFIEWSFDNKINVDLFKVNSIVVKYQSILNNDTIDPFIVGLSAIGEIINEII